MIDTIRGYIDLEHSSHYDFDHLIERKIKSQKDNTSRATFNLSNFKITIRLNKDNKPMRLSFNGSLPKFYFGNNLTHLEWDETKKAIQSISDELNVNLDGAVLLRVDVGRNFIVNKPVHEYISCLVDFPRLEVMRFKDSVTFFSRTGNRSLIFYDKLKEIKDKDKTYYFSIPKEYRNKNILRFEVQLKKKLKLKLRLKRVYVKDLYRDTVQRKLVRIWLNNYKKVIKIPLGINPTYLLHHHNGSFKYLSFHGVERLGFDRFTNMVSNLNLNVKNPSSKRSKMKSTIKELIHNVKENALDDDLVTELDNKMKFINELIK